jgi:uncharacterized membrane protein YfhO
MSDKTSVVQRSYFTGMEYYPAKMSINTAFAILDRGDSISCRQAGTTVSGFARNKNITEFDVHAAAPDSLVRPLIYYKGYAATLDGESIPVGESSSGFVQIPVDRSGNVKVYYKGTIAQKTGWYITLVSIFALCVYIFIQRRKEKVKKNG